MTRAALTALTILAALVIATPRPPAQGIPTVQSIGNEQGESEPMLGTGAPTDTPRGERSPDSTALSVGAPSPSSGGHSPRPTASLPGPAASSGKPALSKPAPSKRPTVSRPRVQSKYGVPWLVRQGIASHMGYGFPPSYLALPHGPGWRARICGAGGCVTMVSNDAGPALYIQRQGRIADLSVAVFERVCGIPASMGLCPVSITILGHV